MAASSLPVRLVASAPPHRVLSVDGAFDAPGLNLSHWPGHVTPPSLRHDLSTGCALAFARLAPDERDRLAAGCTEVVNNHFDTDGTCALWVATHPEEAEDLAGPLLDAAAAGDFFDLPSEDAFVVDQCIANSADPERSFLDGLGELDDLARWQRATDSWMERLPELLRGDREDFRSLFEPELERLRADLAVLDAAESSRRPTLDLTTWTSASAAGRHALFGRSGTDRVLECAAAEGGTTFRLLVGTRSWFDLVSPAPPPRPDLAALVERLNELEGDRRSEGLAWHAQPVESPSPELWFGRPDLPFFGEHNAALAPSGLDAATVAEVVAGAPQTSAG